MINFVHRKELDLDKYNQCIQTAHNARMYAFSWYLDAVSDYWGVLVQDDYQKVMPLPYRKKWAISYTVIPSWVQQLSVYSPDALTLPEITDFIAAIPRQFKKLNLSISSKIPPNGSGFRTMMNYVIPLNRSYEELAKNYSKGRKSDLKKARHSSVEIRSIDSAEALVEQFVQLKGTEVKLPKVEYQKLITLCARLKKRTCIEILEVYDENSARLGGAIFLIEATRITYLFSVSNSEGRAKNIMSLLIDYMIMRHANSELLFDFEGSILASLASFFKSFGAIPEPYYHYQKWRL